MRRLVLRILAVSSIVLLSACSGQGGSAFNGFNTSNNNGNQIDNIIFANPSGGNQGIFKVANIPGAALTISATGVKGSQNAIVIDQAFTWAVTYGSSSNVYQTNVNGNQANCPNVPAGSPNPSVALTYPAFGQNLPQPYTPDVRTNTINVSPVFPATGPTGVALPSSYCLLVAATHLSDGRVGTFVVFVGPS